MSPFKPVACMPILWANKRLTLKGFLLYLFYLLCSYATIKIEILSKPAPWIMNKIFQNVKIYFWRRFWFYISQGYCYAIYVEKQGKIVLCGSSCNFLKMYLFQKKNMFISNIFIVSILKPCFFFSFFCQKKTGIEPKLQGNWEKKFITKNPEVSWTRKPRRWKQG